MPKQRKRTRPQQDSDYDGPWKDAWRWHLRPLLTKYFAQIAAQIAALRTASDPEGRYDAKWQLVRNLYTAGYNAEDIRELCRLIDWMMHLRKDLSERFETQLTTFEESLNMPYVTSMERIAEARGKGEFQLSKIVGPLSADTQQAVSELDIDELTELADDLLGFRTLDDLQAWLSAHPPTPSPE